METEGPYNCPINKVNKNRKTDINDISENR
jgi:hypothetical protein